jgi:hypothetical protein
MGNISSHLAITSAWHGHQAKYEAPANMHPISSQTKPCAPGRLLMDDEVTVASRCL